MNVPDTLLESGWYWAAWVVWLPLFAHCALRAPWGRLRNSGQLNVWLGTVVVLTLIWSLQAGVKPGLSLHLVGAMLFNLISGPRLAFIGLSCVQAAVTLNGSLDWFAFALNSLTVAGVGLASSEIITWVVDRALPKHFFVFIFVGGFFGAALSVLAIGSASVVLLAIAGAYSVEYLVTEYLPYYLLLGFSEAWLTGMVITLMVIYFPQWVSSFDDQRYLANK